MKKSFVLSMALLLCVMSVFVGCSSKNDALEKYAKEQQSQLESGAIDGFAAECSAEGNSLIYTYKYDIEGVELTEEIAQGTLDLLTSASDEILDAVQKEVSSCESVVFKIVNADGKVLADKEIK